MVASSAKSDDTGLIVIPVFIPKTVANMLNEIAGKRGTTMGALMTGALRKMVSDELGEDVLAEMEKEL